MDLFGSSDDESGSDSDAAPRAPNAVAAAVG